jgi:hypothetical protein
LGLNTIDTFLVTPHSHIGRVRRAAVPPCRPRGLGEHPCQFMAAGMDGFQAGNAEL